jgi:hypothetical protein
VSAPPVSFELLCRALETADLRHDGPAPEALSLIEGWREAARTGHYLHPVGAVAEFDGLWPWYLTGMLYASTRATALELRALIEVVNN